LLAELGRFQLRLGQPVAQGSLHLGAVGLPALA
jgi:hypothetical protein